MTTKNQIIENLSRGLDALESEMKAKQGYKLIDVSPIKAKALEGIQIKRHNEIVYESVMQALTLRAQEITLALQSDLQGLNVKMYESNTENERRISINGKPIYIRAYPTIKDGRLDGGCTYYYCYAFSRSEGTYDTIEGLLQSSRFMSFLEECYESKMQ